MWSNRLGTQGMYHNSGGEGADRGVNGVLNFATYKCLEEKSGKIAPGFS